MILDIVISVDDVPIRMMESIWYDHILEEHPYMSGFYEDVLSAIENPTFVLRGYRGAKIAVVNLGRRKWLHVIYRQVSKSDGFIITAFIKPEYDDDKVIWQSDN